MKTTQTILAHYSFLFATLLLGWSLFASPQPEGFILAVLVFPISIYFWVLASGKMPHDDGRDADGHLTGTTSAPSQQKTLGILISVTLTIATASIISYIAFVGNPEKGKSPDSLTEIEAKLDELQSDVAVIKKSSKSIEKIDIKLSLIESTLLKLDNKKSDGVLDNELQGVLSTVTTATPEATITP
jgi:hypothetical protein